MANFNTSANTSADTQIILPSQKLDIMNKIANIVEYRPEIKVRREFVGMVKSPKQGCKGMVKRHKLVTRETGFKVVDTQATVVARKAAMKALLEGKKVAVDNATLQAKVAAKRSIAQRAIEREEARLFQIEQAGFVGQLAHIEEQIAALRAAKPNTSFGKARIRDAKKVNVKAPRVRTGRKPARLTVPACPKVCFIGKLAPVAIPVRESKVSRAEAKALLALANTADNSFVSKASSTMETIAVLDRVDNLVFTALTAIATGEAFLLAAKARMNDTVNTLPAVAATMTMNMNEDLVTIHNFVMNYMVDNGVANYSQAVIDSYEDICDNQGIEVTDELEDAILDMADKGIATGGDVNHDKNITVEVDPSTAQTSVNNTGDSPDMLNNTFESKFPAFNNLVADNGSLSIAEMLFNSTLELFPETHKNETKRAKFIALNNEAKAQVKATVAKWEKALGYITEDFADILVAPGYKLVNNSVDELDQLLDAFNFVTFDKDNEITVGNKTARVVSEDAPHHDFGKRFTAQQLFFSVLAESIADLGDGDKVELLCDLFPGKVEDGFIQRLSDTAVKIIHAEFDFGNGELHKNGYTLNVNRGTMFRKTGVDMLGKDALFMFALSLARQSKKSINTQIGHASNMFKRQENYGAKAESDDIRYHVDNNLVLCAEVRGTANFPFFQVKSANQDGKALGHVLDKGIFAAVDKTNVSWITVENGPAAMGLGVKDGIVMNASDASKPNKVYNRPASNKYLFAAQVDANGVNLRERSNFAFVLPDGNLAYIKGRKLDVIFSNSRFGLGSGIAISNPDLYFPHQVATNVTEPLNLLTLPTEWRDSFGSMEEFANHVAAKVKDSIEAMKGSVVKPGQTIGEIKLGTSDETRVVITNTKQAVDVKVMGSTVTVDDFNDNVLNVKVSVEIAGNDRFVKLRTPFYKATTHPMDVRIGGIAPSEWDLLLNIECVKGQNMLAVMWANAHGFTGVDMSRGVATVGNREIDLTIFDNEIAEWRRANVKTTTITHKIARSVFDELEHQMILDDVEIVSKGKRQVVVKETVEYIKGQAHFDIEIATPRESVGTSNMTFEQQNAVLLQDRKLGEDIMSGLNTKVQDLNSLIVNYSEVADTKSVTFDGTTVKGREEFSYFAFGAVGGFIKYATNHRGVLKCLDKALDKVNAHEVVITGDKNVKVAISPKALLAFGQFSRNGSSAREAAKIIDFLFYLVNVVATGTHGSTNHINQEIAKAANTMAQWAQNITSSSKALKKVTRAGEIVCGKVRTSWIPELHSDDGIPVLALNPKCPMRRLLGVKPGDLVAINRTPMPFITVARIVFTDKIDVAHAAISPLWWHLANEGDSDGDGIGIMALAGYGINRERAKAINNALMGPAGYLWMYANVRSYDEFLAIPAAERPELPFDDFMSYDDKHGKKAISFNAKNSIPFVTTHVKGQQFNVDVYADYAKLVNGHYKAAVGSSYAICSQLVFTAAELVYHTGDFDVVRCENTIKACVVAWRMIYEGLGLAGWSTNATEFFRYFKAAAFDYEQGRVKRQDTGAITSFYSRTGGERNAKPILTTCLAKAGLAEAVNDSTLLTSLLRSQMVVTVYQKLERGDDVHGRYTNLENAAIVAGTLRRIGQGKDPVVIEEGPADILAVSTDEQGPLSMTEAFNERKLGSLLKNPAISVVSKAACAAHVVIRDMARQQQTDGLVG